MVLKEDLEKRICDCEECNNSQTYREYIRGTEDEMELEPADIDSMTVEELNEYIDYLDFLWRK